MTTVVEIVMEDGRYVEGELIKTVDKSTSREPGHTEEWCITVLFKGPALEVMEPCLVMLFDLTEGGRAPIGSPVRGVCVASVLQDGGYVVVDVELAMILFGDGDEDAARRFG